MDTNHLRTFICVAECGSFNKAARQLYLSSNAIIKQINALEAQLGKVTLFHRSFSGVTLTPSGQVFYKDAKKLLHLADQTITRARQADVETNKIIYIGASAFAPISFLSKLCKQVQEKDETFRYQIVYERSLSNEPPDYQRMRANFDILFSVYNDHFLKLANMQALHLSDRKVQFGVSTRHLLASKDKITIEDLAKETLFLGRRGICTQFDEIRQAVLEPITQNIIEFEELNPEVLNKCEMNGLIMLMIDYWQNINPLLKLLDVDWEYTLPHGIIYPSNPSEKVASFIRLVKEIKAL